MALQRTVGNRAVNRLLQPPKPALVSSPAQTRMSAPLTEEPLAEPAASAPTLSLTAPLPPATPNPPPTDGATTQRHWGAPHLQRQAAPAKPPDNGPPQPTEPGGAPARAPNQLTLPPGGAQPVAEYALANETPGDNPAIQGTMFTLSERIHKLLWYLIIVKNALLVSQYKDPATGQVDKRALAELDTYKKTVLKLQGHMGAYSTQLSYAELIALVRAEQAILPTTPDLSPNEVALRKTSQLFQPAVRQIVNDYSGLKYRPAGSTPFTSASPLELLRLLVEEQRQAKPTAEVTEAQAAQAQQHLEKFLAAIQTDRQALTVLVQLQDQFPDWVWSTIVARTDLRALAPQNNWLQAGTQQRQTASQSPASKGLVPAWDTLLKKWAPLKNWRQQPSARLRYLVGGLVCNELAQVYQRLAGQTKFPDMIKGQADFYRTAAPPGKKGVLARPQTRQEIVPNASLFVLKWQEEPPGNPPPPDFEYWATDNSAPRDKTPITEEVVHGPYRYAKRLEGGKTLITRVAVGPDGQPQYFRKGDKAKTLLPATATRDAKGALLPEMLEFKQYLTWGHVCTIVEVLYMLDDKNEHVITIDTNATGLNRRLKVSDLLDTWNHFVGYFAETTPTPAEATAPTTP